MTRLFESEEIQTSRQYYLDILKALAIVAMILCHAIVQFGMHHTGYEHDVLYWVGDYFFGDYLAAAHAFMFAMGVGIVYSTKNKPADLIRRGIRLYILAFVLNFFRYGIYLVADGLIEGEFMAETIYALIVQDIFHFAGLALIAAGLFKKLKLSVNTIFLIGVIMSVAGGFLAFAYQGNPVVNYLLGHFIVTTEEDSCFAFFNWYIFVATGLLFGTILRRTEDLDKFYRRLLCIAGPTMFLYIVLTIIFGTFFMTKNEWYYATTLPESIGLISIDLTLLCFFYFLLKKVDVSRLSVFIKMSRSLTSIYCIQWCIIGFVDSIFCYLLGIVFPYPVILLFGIILIPVSYWIAKLWVNWKTKGEHNKG